MTPKERVLAMLNHREADCVPHGETAFDSVFFKEACGHDTLAYGGWSELEALWGGRRDDVVNGYVEAFVEITKRLEWDFVRVPAAPRKKDYSGFKRTGDFTFQDDRGNSFHYNPSVGNVVLPVKWNADMDISELGSLDAPFEVAEEEMDIARGVVERIGKTHFVIGRTPVGGTFPHAQSVGLEEFLIRLITDPEFVIRATEIANKKAVAYCRAFINAGCDGFMETDDYADTKGLLMGKARYEEFILPYLRRICEAVHEAGGYFIKHTDGVMWDALDSFVEAKVDGWQGIQPSLGMDIKLLKEKYGGKLCLFGGINGETMIEGPPEKIREEVRYAVKHGAPGGGLVVTCGNILEPGVSAGNYLAKMDEMKKIGNYPITKTL